MKIHHALPDQGGQELMETLCNMLVVPVRNESKPGLLRFTSFRTGGPINVVFDPRDVTCNTCQHVWRKIR